MKYALVAATLAAVVSAQSLSDIPSCAIPCLDDAISSETSCETTDIACVCSNFEAIQGAATSCVVDACGSDTAINEVLPATQKLCESAGEGSSAASSAAEGTTAAPATTSSVVATSAAPATSAAESSVLVTSAVTTVSSATESSFTAVTPSANSTSATSAAPSASSSAVVTGGAAAIGSIGSFAMMVLGALAL